jgi:hypothetical protein
MTHSSQLSFSKEAQLRVEGHPQQSTWTCFLEKLATELKAEPKAEWIYRGLNENRAKNKDAIKLTIESSFDREWSNLWLVGEWGQEWGQA